MTNSRTSAAIFIVLPMLVSALPGGGVLAQDEAGERQDTAEEAPRSLLQSQSKRINRPEGSVELPAAPGREDTVISSDLDTVGTEIFGVLEPADGGMGYGLWRGSSLSTIISLMEALPEEGGTGVWQDLLTRLLLSRAFDPVEADRFGVNARSRFGPAGAPFLTLRAAKLLRAGFLREAERALDQSDEPLDDLASLHVRSEIFLLTGRTRAACGIAARTRAESDDPYWSRLRALCYLVARDPAAARLTGDLLAESGYEDPLFFAALANRLDGADISFGASPVEDGVHFVLLSENSDGIFPRELLNSRSSAVRSASMQLASLMARGQEELLNIQIPLAEAHGAEGLGTLYGSVVMSDTESTALVNSRSAQDLSPKRSAAIYQALEVAVMPGDHGDLLKIAWDDAARQYRSLLFVALYGEALSDLAVEPALDIYASEFAKASLLAGEYQRAAQWLALARDAPGHSGSGVTDDDKLLRGLDVALRIVAPLTVRGEKAQGPGLDLAGRLDEAVTSGQTGKMRRSLLEVRLYQAFGGRLDAATRQALAASASVVANQSAGVMPPTGILSRMDAAARAGRKGETVLLALLALATSQGDSKSAHIPIIVTSRCVSALVRTGFITEAKTLAIESLLAEL